MFSAFGLPRVDLSAPQTTCLLQSLSDLLRAVDGRAVLLRPLSTSIDSQSDDIDVLLTESQRKQLMCGAKAACLQGQIHCRIRQSGAAKAELTLWTIDCSQKLKIDLWTNFDQLPHQRRKSISAARLLSTLSPVTRHPETNAAHETADPRIPALRQLPPDIDLCLLLQHLAKKRKSLTARAVRERINAACSRLAAWSPDPATVSLPHDLLATLRELAAELGKANIITQKNIAISEDYLVRRLAGVAGNRGLRILEPRRSRGLLTGLRSAIKNRLPCLAVVGSDGAGKSSVVTAFVTQQTSCQAVVAKKLYRRSITYRIVSSLFTRPGGLHRGFFDDRFARIATLRAIPSMWMRLLLSPNRFSQSARPVPEETLRRVPGATIFDRSVASFLIRDRKSHTPTLAPGATWIESLIPPVTSVLLLLPYAELTRRKQEMSACGHEQYQRLLFEQALRQMPVDVVLLASMESADAAAHCIGRIIEPDERSVCQPKTLTHLSPVRKAAA